MRLRPFILKPMDTMSSVIKTQRVRLTAHEPRSTDKATCCMHPKSESPAGLLRSRPQQDRTMMNRLATGLTPKG